MTTVENKGTNDVKMISFPCNLSKCTFLLKSLCILHFVAGTLPLVLDLPLTDRLQNYRGHG